MREDKRFNEIIRIKKHTSNFVLLDKTFLEDDRLSFKAKGILAYLLSKPDDWKVIVGHLVTQSKDGKASVYAGLKELKEYGYYTKVPIRNEEGTRIIRWESTVYEVPCENQEVEEETTLQEETMYQADESVQEETMHQTNESQQEENEKTEDRSIFSLVSDYQDIENQFLENRERNKNDTTNNYNTNMDSSPVLSYQTKTDGPAMFKKILAVIHNNIGYQDLKVAHTNDMELIDDFVAIMADAMLSKGEMVRIGKEEKPRELIKSSLMKLNYFDIQNVLWKFKSYRDKIQKKSQYILSMLYHCALERNIELENQMQVNFGCL